MAELAPMATRAVCHRQSVRFADHVRALGRLKSAQPEAIRAILMLTARIAPQSEVIRAILLEGSPCRRGVADLVDVALPLRKHLPVQHTVSAAGLIGGCRIRLQPPKKPKQAPNGTQHSYFNATPLPPPSCRRSTRSRQRTAWAHRWVLHPNSMLRQPSRLPSSSGDPLASLPKDGFPGTTGGGSTGRGTLSTDLIPPPPRVRRAAHLIVGLVRQVGQA